MFGAKDLLPLPDDMRGCICAIRASGLGKRYQMKKFQLVAVAGGFGAERGNIGSKVFGEHIVDGEHAQFRRNDFIGVPTEAQIAAAMAEEGGPLPIDPDDMTYLVIGKGLAFAKDVALDQAKKLCKKYGDPLLAYRCHVETHLTDFGSLEWPKDVAAPELVWQKEK